ncbi:hypothetical protein HPB47_019074 [Ixodes persulcatus]|uniref:Uncharacterized protein n=1 Tax=Ixodes persulcatus TaxID=34615 RepID=A0AC60QJD2_IXOPE|nr:hypothetical protein HPB47_019074 [Ixodes persulcatus]
MPLINWDEATATDLSLNMQLLTAYLQQSLQIAARSVNVTTLPDLSSTLSLFSGDGGISARRWLEDLERTQELASHRTGKTLRSSHRLESDNREPIQVVARMETSLSLIQWQTRVATQQQPQGESFVNYTLAKLKTVARCPVTLTDQQQLKYVIQGVRNRQHPSTESLFMTIVTDLDRTLDHNQSPTTPPAPGASAAPHPPLPRPRPSPPRPRLYTQPIAAAFSTYSPEELPGSKFTCMIVPVTVAGTSAILPQPAVVGVQLLPNERNQVQAILKRHAPLFATSDHDLGLHDKVGHTIDLVQVTPTAALADMQREDSECCAIRRHLTSSGDAGDECIVLDVLYRRSSADLCHLLELCHDSSGHMDLTRTLAKFECRYWWQRMSTTVSHYVESYLTCHLNTGLKRLYEFFCADDTGRSQPRWNAMPTLLLQVEDVIETSSPKRQKVVPLGPEELHELDYYSSEVIHPSRKCTKLRFLDSVAFASVKLNDAKSEISTEKLLLL